MAPQLLVGGAVVLWPRERQAMSGAVVLVSREKGCIGCHSTKIGHCSALVTRKAIRESKLGVVALELVATVLWS